MRTRRNENGQAFVEMCAGLIAIMMVLVGVIFTASVGKESVLTLITSRENADAGRGSIYPSYIEDWDLGEDGIAFSGDDSFATGVDVDNNDFSRQLGSNSTISLLSHARLSKLDLVTGSQEDDIFLDASHMMGAQGNNLGMTNQLIDDLGLEIILNTFFGYSNLDIPNFRGNQIFMPEPLNQIPNP